MSGEQAEVERKKIPHTGNTQPFRTCVIYGQSIRSIRSKRSNTVKNDFFKINKKCIFVTGKKRLLTFKTVNNGPQHSIQFKMAKNGKNHQKRLKTV